jgi:hypothetical protein
MAIAGIESNFNPSSKSKSGTYWGIFQLSNGWGGCNGDDRLDLVKSIKCFWNGSKNSHYRDKERWKQIDNSWDDFYYYGIHQQGFAGFKDIYVNRNKKLSEVSDATRNRILNNKPSSATWSNVNDWWNYFRNKFYSIYNQYATDSNMRENIALEHRPFISERLKDILIIGGGVTFFGYMIYDLFIKKPRRYY